MKTKKLFALLTALVMLLTSASALAVGENEPVLDPPVTVTSMMLEDNLRACPADTDMYNNPFYSLYQAHGITVDYVITGSMDEINTKLNLAIVDGELPDIMEVNAATFRELAEAGMLADLTEVFDKYASEELKRRYNADGGLMLSNCYVDGKLYGLAMPSGYEDYIPVVCVRTDWLKELGMEEPKSMEDVWTIAKAFKDNNMGGTCTIGVGLTQNMATLLEPTVGLLNGYGAFTNTWLEQDGKLVNSNIQPEMRAALEDLAKRYAEGLIDPEFGTKSMANVTEDVLSGRCGVWVSHFCAPFDLGNGVAQGQEWGYYNAMALEGGLGWAQASIGFSGCVAVSAECENPEAAIIMLNLFADANTNDPANYGDNGLNNYAWPLKAVNSTLTNNFIHQEYLAYLENGTEYSKDSVSTIESAEKWRLNGDQEGYIMWAVFGQDSTQTCIDNIKEADRFKISAYTGATTDLMNEYNSILNDLLNQTFTAIIKGDESIEAFDAFVEEWLEQGGQEITDEVNEWYANR